MRTHFLLGPAGSGKTTRCLAEIRAALGDPLGAPLLVLAPKQATFQLERQILSFPDVMGYTRLQILSFERLAEMTLENLGAPSLPLLEEEGRVMVLRALLMELQSRLGVFHATARLPGFARQLSALLRECQRQQVTPAKLREISGNLAATTGAMPAKLRDMALVLEAYEQWLTNHGLRDASQLLDIATTQLRELPKPGLQPSGEAAIESPIQFEAIWLDGFAEMTPQELDFLSALLPHAQRATLAFCLDHVPVDDPSWLSTWAVVGQTFRRCWQRVNDLPGMQVTIETLDRNPKRSRFAASSRLAQLEAAWTRGSAVEVSTESEQGSDAASEDESLALVQCVNQEAEAILAAREILRFVRTRGGRFRDTAVLVRSLDAYHATVGRVFSRYGIPFFMDRRSPASHHPLAELTRSALRVVALGWRHEDVFGALKTGLTGVDDVTVDRLENASLSHGWNEKDWCGDFRWPSGPAAGEAGWVHRARERFVPLFQKLAKHVGGPDVPAPSGKGLATALRALFEGCRALEQIEQWSQKEQVRWSQPTRVHLTVWEEIQSWLDNLERAFGDRSMPLREWLPILEAGLGSLTVGVVPPALDQVLVGAIDRSRNPELRLAVVLGMNDSVFPALPDGGNLLTELERERLAADSVYLGGASRRQVGHERYYGYIACTRASERLVISWSNADSRGRPLLPSPFVTQLRTLFPTLNTKDFAAQIGLLEAEHSHEIAADCLGRSPRTSTLGGAVAGFPSEGMGVAIDRLGWKPLFAKWAELEHVPTPLGVAAVTRLYGSVLKTSVSALEDFAACPFKFFVARGLGARERELFDADARERGSFQHELLQAFHESVVAQEKRWRDLKPADAATRVRELGGPLLESYRGGLFQSSAAAIAHGRILVERTALVMEGLVGWMDHYSLDPVWVEADFGMTPESTPGLEIPLPEGRSIYLRGRVDRVDVGTTADPDVGLAVIIDYKSSARALDSVKMEHGLQLQLLAYLAVATRRSEVADRLGFRELRPAGAFYVCLNPQPRSVDHRAAGSESKAEERLQALKHRGRFDKQWIQHLDDRSPPEPGQFAFRLNKDGSFSKSSVDSVAPDELARLMDQSLDRIREFGEAIFRGESEPSPSEIKKERACDRCDYRSICRFDPWVDRFRVLASQASGGAE